MSDPCSQPKAKLKSESGSRVYPGRLHLHGGKERGHISQVDALVHHMHLIQYLVTWTVNLQTKRQKKRCEHTTFFSFLFLTNIFHVLSSSIPHFSLFSVWKTVRKTCSKALVVFLCAASHCRKVKWTVGLAESWGSFIIAKLLLFFILICKFSFVTLFKIMNPFCFLCTFDGKVVL